ncbi:MAG TPA: SDR family NAD(P)-dependent oxidoreductase [Anaerolineales bacterium]|nr:SDR family NAD(P)-dependent oxidoreductase [Anaerolineales bacterium]
MQSVVVTGVSTGIGWAITKLLIERGFRVFGSVRKTQDAERLSKEFGEHFVPLLFDVTDEPAVRAAAHQVREQLNGEILSGLVNNAGIAVPAPLIHQSTDDFRHQLEVNLVSVLSVTKAFVPLLGADRSLRGKPGRIINISSTSGKFGFPFVGAYVTSKHGLEGFSESLRRELMLYGIDVIIVAPGAIATPIWDKAEQLDLSAYANTEYVEPARHVQKFMVKNGRNGLPAERVGEIVWHALTTPRPRVRYALAPGSFISRILPRIMPKRLIDRVVAKNLGLRKQIEDHAEDK